MIYPVNNAHKAELNAQYALLQELAIKDPVLQTALHKPIKPQIDHANRVMLHATDAQETKIIV